MRSHRYRAEGLEPVCDLQFEPGRVTKTFHFRNGGKTPCGTAYLALALKGIELAASGAAVMLNRTPLSRAAPHAHRGGWRWQVVAFPGRCLRDGLNEVSIIGVRIEGGSGVAQEAPRLAVTVRLDSDV